MISVPSPVARYSDHRGYRFRTLAHFTSKGRPFLAGNGPTGPHQRPRSANKPKEPGSSGPRLGPPPFSTARVLSVMRPYRATGEATPGFGGRRGVREGRDTGLPGKNTGLRGKSAASRRDPCGSPASPAPSLHRPSELRLKVNLTLRAARPVLPERFRSAKPKCGGRRGQPGVKSAALGPPHAANWLSPSGSRGRV